MLGRMARVPRGDVKLFRRAWSAPVGGMLTAQPLFVPPAYTAPMTAGSLVFVGTANGTVIAFGSPARVATGSKTR